MHTLYISLFFLSFLACVVVVYSTRVFDSLLKTSVTCISLVALSFLAYYHFGNANGYHQLLVKQKHQKEVARVMQELKTPNKVIARMRQQLNSKPNDSKGWYLLGRLYYTTKQFNQAVAAFSRANDLKPGDTTIMMQYANASFFAEGQKLNLKARALLQAILKINPKEAEALNLLAMDAYFSQQYQKAIAYWEQTDKALPLDSEDRQQVQAAIARARIAANPNALHLKVAVSVDSAISARYPSDTPVFIFAKSPSGPPMPLAVVKTRLGDLPQQIDLSDANAMSPNWHLSSVASAYVMVKLSKSGNPLAKQGTVSVRSKLIDLQKAQSVKLVLK